MIFLRSSDLNEKYFVFVEENFLYKTASSPFKSDACGVYNEFILSTFGTDHVSLFSVVSIVNGFHVNESVSIVMVKSSKNILAEDWEIIEKFEPLSGRAGTTRSLINTLIIGRL
uniref:Uncharacterized protein n=1 Tax=Strongyloides venezuelensis TaxID=75913 RepID=A0A0K0FXC3_STRVS